MVGRRDSELGAIALINSLTGRKIPMGALPLTSFNKVQEPLLLDQLVKLERSAAVAEAAGLSCLDERWTDLQIYRAQLRRILSNSLYFLKVKADGQTFYKIGITTRSISERIAPGAAGCEGALLGCFR